MEAFITWNSYAFKGTPSQDLPQSQKVQGVKIVFTIEGC